MKKQFTLLLALASTLSLQAQFGPVGFCNYYDDGRDGVTGGMGGEVVYVTTREALAQALAGDEPRTIYLQGTLTGKGLQRIKDVIQIGSNKTLVGMGPDTKLEGIGLQARGKQNIILRNMTIHHGSPDAIAFYASHHIWVDHCDVYSEDEPVREDWDGLIDCTGGSSYITVSYSFIHDHHKVCLLNSGTMHYEDQGRERATYHHNYFVRTDQRNPRIGYGLGHVMNNYYEQIGSYCIGGHTQAQIVSEHNYFSPTASHPFRQMYAQSTDEASCAFFTDRGSYYANGKETVFEYAETGTDFEPAWWYDYDFARQAPEVMGQQHKALTGPTEGLEHEAILWPGNGATSMPLSTRPQWSKILGETKSRMLLGTDPAQLKAAKPDRLKLQPATTYYWRVESTAKGKTYTSPLYRFTTATAQASHPLPSDGETHAQLRVATAQREFATAMPLRWRRAAQADYYEVWLWNEQGEAVVKQQRANKTELNPGDLRQGEKYTWRVDVVTTAGQRIQGQTWSFASERKPIALGRTELEHLSRSAYAYLEHEDGKRFTASNDTMTVGEAGPGAMIGTYTGPAGTYRVKVAFHDEKVGQSLMALTLNGQQVEVWTGERSTRHIVHTIARPVALKPGDELRIDFVIRGRMRCRMDYIEIEEIR